MEPCVLRGEILKASPQGAQGFTGKAESGSAKAVPMGSQVSQQGRDLGHPIIESGLFLWATDWAWELSILC